MRTFWKQPLAMSGLFFLFMALVEDTGYLSRAAFLTDALMARLGLDGRSFVMMLMGFGYDLSVIALIGDGGANAAGLAFAASTSSPGIDCSAPIETRKK